MSLPEGHPAHVVTREHEAAVLALLHGELRRAGHPDPDTAAAQLAMLLDALDALDALDVSAVLRPDAGAGTAVLPLLDAILDPPRQTEPAPPPT